MNADRGDDGGGEKDRRAETAIRREAERGPTAAHQGADKPATGDAAARGMQTGAEGDLTARPDGKPGTNADKEPG